MYLFEVHCGYYDARVAGGHYENHVNFFVIADSFESAKAKAKENPLYMELKMHLDGLVKIEKVDGYHINLDKREGMDTLVTNFKVR